MAIIHVRSLPEDLIVQLQARAKGHHRSMEAEVRSILAEAIQPPPVNRGQRHVNFALIAKMDLGEVVFEPMSPSLREIEP
jgi:plasmid stability protein